MTFNQGEHMNIRERIRRLLQEAGELEKWHVPPRDRLPDNDQRKDMVIERIGTNHNLPDQFQ